MELRSAANAAPGGDVARDETLDEMCATVAAVLGMPTAFAAIVDETTLSTRSVYGMTHVRLPRASTPCDRTMRSAGAHVLPADDAAASLPRGIGFYAGTPVRDARGVPVGTLCVVDAVPRTFGARDRETLERFGSLVGRHFTERARAAGVAAERDGFGAAIDASRAAVFTIAGDGTITTWSDGAEALLGWPASAVVGRSVAALDSEGLAARTFRGGFTEAEDAMRARIRGGFSIREHAMTSRHRDGTPIAVRMAIGPVRDASGDVVGAACVVRDARAEIAAREHDRRRAEILEHAARDAPLDAQLARICEMLEAALPDTVTAIVARRGGVFTPLATGAAMHPSYAAAVERATADLTDPALDLVRSRFGDVRLALPGVDPLWKPFPGAAARLGFSASWSTPVPSSDGVSAVLVAYLREPRAGVAPTTAERDLLLDVARLTAIVLDGAKLHADLERSARTDALTGLGNRVELERRLAAAIGGALRDGSRAALVSIDFDRFKLVNDTFGHAFGDALLRVVGSRLEAAARPHLLARTGGDEFIALATGLASAAEAAAFRDRLRDVFRESFSCEGREIFVHASAGVACWPEDGGDAASLLRAADGAMYERKRPLRSADLATAALMPAPRLALETALAGALDRGEFRLEYQPIVHLESGRVTSAEALLRWDHPQLGAISPAAFVPIAEETGAIVPIGAWVIREAAAFAARWRDAGGAGLVAVNVSPRQFDDPGFRRVVEGALASAELAPCGLLLEITEGLVIRDPVRVAVMLEELRTLGIRSAIDDFGVGESSLAYLRRFPVDALKIDRTFIASVHDADGGEAAIVRAILAVGRALGLMVVGEGVETAEQARILAELGCGFVQGYHFARPLPEAAFVARAAAIGA